MNKEKLTKWTNWVYIGCLISVLLSTASLPAIMLPTPYNIAGTIAFLFVYFTAFALCRAMSGKL